MVDTAAPSITASLREYGRGLAGGLIFSLPLLYTMEVWWAGFIARPVRLFSYILAIFLLLLGYNRYAGMRRDASWLEVAIDSIKELELSENRVLPNRFVMAPSGRTLLRDRLRRNQLPTGARLPSGQMRQLSCHMDLARTGAITLAIPTVCAAEASG
ncbi:MAG: hypothetical protein QOJ98_610 [Acidobacteriota bacterium]|jgi:hypothetical protein|nr:hypothetical protein [Acidobacteriota bacterium]